MDAPSFTRWSQMIFPWTWIGYRNLLVMNIVGEGQGMTSRLGH